MTGELGEKRVSLVPQRFQEVLHPGLPPQAVLRDRLLPPRAVGRLAVAMVMQELGDTGVVRLQLLPALLVLVELAGFLQIPQRNRMQSPGCRVCFTAMEAWLHWYWPMVW